MPLLLQQLHIAIQWWLELSEKPQTPSTYKMNENAF
jgi:hypothetical protein